MSEAIGETNLLSRSASLELVNASPFFDAWVRASIRTQALVQNVDAVAGGKIGLHDTFYT